MPTHPSCGTIRQSLLLLSIFVIMLSIGIWSGEYRSVLEKAIALCLSCVGIG